MARRALPRRAKGFAVSAQPDKTGRGTPPSLMWATLNTYKQKHGTHPGMFNGGNRSAERHVQVLQDVFQGADGFREEVGAAEAGAFARDH